MQALKQSEAAFTQIIERDREFENFKETIAQQPKQDDLHGFIEKEWSNIVKVTKDIQKQNLLKNRDRTKRYGILPEDIKKIDKQLSFVKGDQLNDHSVED